MKRYWFCMVASVFMLFIVQAHAGSPIWTYSAPSPSSVGVADGELATIQYTVTNQSQRPKNLVLKTTPGLHASACVLAGKGSTCTLTVFASGSQIPLEGLHGGPMMCEHGSTSQCYQPSSGNELNIIKRVPQGSLSLSTSSVSFMQGQTSSLVTLTNTSTFATVSGLNLTPSANVSFVSNSCGASLAPQESCTFSVTSSVITPSSVTISANNASSVSLGVTVNGISISANPTSLTLTTVSPGNTGVVTITNNPANTVNAENITADLSGTGGALSAVYSGCTSIPPAGTCTITFTANSTLTAINIPIQGSNASPVYVSVGVDQATITLSPTSLSLTEGDAVGTAVTITNTGSVDAYSIGAVSPGLGITVSGSCASPLTPGSTCQLTFTPGSTSGTVTATIAGSNTNNASLPIAVHQATISISPTSLSLSEGDTVGTAVTITNTGSVDAYNIGSASPGLGITVSGSCASPLTPSSTCQLTFTPGTTVGTATATIVGSNTNSVSLPISVSKTTLSISTSSLTLATDGIFTSAATGLVSGTCPTTWITPGSGSPYCQSKARTFTVTNGSYDAVGVTYSGTLPAGTTVSLSGCGYMTPGQVCTVTITPGTTPSTASPGAPTASVITISGTNTNSVSANITLITYGNSYTSSSGKQGYVFSINDTIATAGSVTGIIMATNDTTDSPTVWSTASSTSCPNYGANWYLPGTCQMAYYSQYADFNCRTINGPAIQNIQSNLFDSGLVTAPSSSTYYWSSSYTSVAGGPIGLEFGSGVGFALPPTLPSQVRCIYNITP